MSDEKIMQRKADIGKIADRLHSVLDALPTERKSAKIGAVMLLANRQLNMFESMLVTMQQIDPIETRKEKEEALLKDIHDFNVIGKRIYEFFLHEEQGGDL